MEQQVTDNIKWRDEIIAKLPNQCSCIPHLVKDMLLMAIDERIDESRHEMERIGEIQKLYPTLYKRSMPHWKDRFEEAQISASTYDTLRMAIGSIKTCD